MYLGNFFAVPSSWVRTNPLPSHDVIFQKNNPLQHLPPCHSILSATFIDNLHPNRSVFIHVHVRYRYVSWSLELLKDGGIANMYNGYPLHFCVVDISPPLWHLIAFFYSGPKKILEVSAIPGRPVVRAEQAPATSPNFKNQFNIVVTQ